MLRIQNSILRQSILACLTVAGVALNTAAAAPAIALPSNIPSAPIADTGQLGTQWWQLLISIPGPQNPSFDETGASCGIGQRGHTWFLYSPFSTRAGPIGEPVELKCTIPAGKTIFLAVLPFICTPFLGETIEDAVQFCKETIDLVDVRRLRINGEARNDLIERRAVTAHSRCPHPTTTSSVTRPAFSKQCMTDTSRCCRRSSRVITRSACRRPYRQIGIEFDTRYRLHIVKPEIIPLVP